MNLYIFSTCDFWLKKGACGKPEGKKKGNQKHKQGPYENGVGQRGRKQKTGVNKNGQGWSVPIGLGKELQWGQGKGIVFGNGARKWSPRMAKNKQNGQKRQKKWIWGRGWSK